MAGLLTRADWNEEDHPRDEDGKAVISMLGFDPSEEEDESESKSEEEVEEVEEVEEAEENKAVVHSTIDIPNVLSSRQKSLDSLAGPWRLKEVRPGVHALHTRGALVEQAAVDTRKLAVPCIITTQDEDRERDVILTAGGDLAKHETNPVVLLDHGWTRDGRYPSVAQARDPDSGLYTVSREATRMRAVSWFSEKIEDSYQTFELIDAGLLNGVSIGFTVNLAKYREDHPDDYRGWPGLLIAQWELVEYSHCPIGINPYALADRIGKGTLSGRPITQGVWKSLSGYLPPLREMVTGGFEKPAGEKSASEETPNKEPEMAKNDDRAPEQKPEEKPTPAPAPAKKAEGMNEEEGSSGGYVAMQDDENENGKGKKEEEKPEEETPEEDPMKDWLPGAKVLAGCHALLAVAGEFVVDGYRMQENENVKAVLDNLSEGLAGMCDEVDGCFQNEYPDYDPPSGKRRSEDDEGDDGSDEDSDDSEDDEQEEEPKKSRLTPAGRKLAQALQGRKSLAQGRPVMVSDEQAQKEISRLREENEALKASLEKTSTLLEGLQKAVKKKIQRR